MPEEKTKPQIDLSWLETPWTIRQVETHLIFGPISRHLPFAYVILAAGIIAFVSAFFASGVSFPQYLGRIFDKLLFLVVPFIFLRLPPRQQAIIGWAVCKGTLAFAAFILLTVGAPLSFVQHKSDAWAFLFLGLIWLPHLELIPALTPYQKYLTLARFLLSIPCVIIGVRSGNWH